MFLFHLEDILLSRVKELTEIFVLFIKWTICRWPLMISHERKVESPRLAGEAVDP
jgi:hypothetical protein